MTSRPGFRFSTAVTVGLLAVASCVASAGDPVEVAEGTEFRLQPGQAARVMPGEIEIRFIDVESDSRCAKGDQCVWAGDAVVRLRLVSPGAPAAEVRLHTAGDKDATARFANHEVRLVGLFPEPVSGRALEADAYIAILVVTPGRGPDENYR